jgi:CelD/BcsL family acetyltransferase involved in cellulose biosynthesis
MVLLGSVLHTAFDGEIKRVELLGGNERYKRSFAKDVQDKLRFQAFEPSALGRLSWAAFAHGRPLAKQAVAVARRVGERVPSR